MLVICTYFLRVRAEGSKSPTQNRTKPFDGIMIEKRHFCQLNKPHEHVSHGNALCVRYIQFEDDGHENRSIFILHVHTMQQLNVFLSVDYMPVDENSLHVSYENRGYSTLISCMRLAPLPLPTTSNAFELSNAESTGQRTADNNARMSIVAYSHSLAS